MNRKLLECEIHGCLRDVGSCIDGRHIAYHVEPEISKKEILLTGFVHFPQQEQALLDKIGKSPSVKKEKISVRSGLKILSRRKIRFFQVSVPSSNMRRDPRKNGEVVTQILLGAFVLGYFSRGRYLYGADPHGYLGYIEKENLIEKSRKDYLEWLNGLRGRLIRNVPIKGGFLPMGSELICPDREHVLLPDGKKMRISGGSVYCYDPARHKKIRPIVKTARSFIGTPYLWGGKAKPGIDCSGFVQVVFLANRIALPRDASQQINVGQIMGMLGDFSDFLPGDLLFFMGQSSRIVHVGISLGGDRFLHATLREGIKESPIDDIDMGNRPFCDYYIMGRRVLV